LNGAAADEFPDDGVAGDEVVKAAVLTITTICNHAASVRRKSGSVNVWKKLKSLIGRLEIADGSLAGKT
jgi:hypothetical protein